MVHSVWLIQGQFKQGTYSQMKLVEFTESAGHHIT